MAPTASSQILYLCSMFISTVFMLKF